MIIVGEQALRHCLVKIRRDGYFNDTPNSGGIRSQHKGLIVIYKSDNMLTANNDKTVIVI